MLDLLERAYVNFDVAASAYRALSVLQALFGTVSQGAGAYTYIQGDAQHDRAISAEGLDIKTMKPLLTDVGEIFPAVRLPRSLERLYIAACRRCGIDVQEPMDTVEATQVPAAPAPASPAETLPDSEGPADIASKVSETCLEPPHPKSSTEAPAETIAS